MFSIELMKFLVSRDAEEYIPKAEGKEIKKEADANGIYRHKRYATVPIELQK